MGFPIQRAQFGPLLLGYSTQITLFDAVHQDLGILHAHLMGLYIVQRIRTLYT